MRLIQIKISCAAIALGTGWGRHLVQTCPAETETHTLTEGWPDRGPIVKNNTITI